MFAYKTNNPQYLDYVARYMTRQQIEDDPVLCQWLNNPYVKDNMELAIRYNEAQIGNFQNKKDFVEYYLCNGPELDVDTLLYYREKILLDATYKEIAYTYYADINVVDDLRKTVYNKDYSYTGKDGKTYEDCFKQPCDYLGPFSCRTGIMAYAKHEAASPNNAVAAMSEEEKLKGKDGKKAADVSDKAIPKPQGQTDTKPAETKKLPVPKWLQHLCTPSMLQLMEQHNLMRSGQVEDYVKKLKEAGKLKYVQQGDPYIISMAEEWSLTYRANMRRYMGDCYRLWHEVTNFNPYDPVQNKQRPISPSETVGNTLPNGQQQTKPEVSPKEGPSSTTTDTLFAQGNYAKYLSEVKAEANKDVDIKGALDTFKNSQKTNDDVQNLKIAIAQYMLSQNSNKTVDIQKIISELNDENNIISSSSVWAKYLTPSVSERLNK